MKRDNSSSFAGFTLLEVMLSMAIFAIAGISMVKIIGEQLIRSKVLEDKIIASWVADNILTEINIKRIEQAEQWVKGSELMMNKLWYWQSKETKIGEVSIVTVEVRGQVYSKNPDIILERYRYINE
ncbi:type II secretion system minor pseudopilin GspI [Yersinia frederiksenii]|uniref:type II secretion system minor pseudopilin GspI n=1 Tax=Yersinia frederiksenii TaxID=29484 RepID=UPI0025AA72DF|nr:type II secretion system minor pseudopilin GspI [Yersinia frederiksenii]MDN0121549.1 type II secretion system minor pseudopilin GspI [Yersinia frederiksenii]